MVFNPELFARIEQLRIPFDGRLGTKDWKDWYHFILMDLQQQIRILVNITLMGWPEHGEIQVTFIVHFTAEQVTIPLAISEEIVTFGHAGTQLWRTPLVQPFPLHIQGRGIDLVLENNRFRVTVQDPRNQLYLQFQALPQATPLLVTEDSPFGSGFIGWGLVPGLQVAGELTLANSRFPLNSNWYCYHDRNFGRFRWGEDIGWEWFVAFLTSSDGRTFTLVLDKRTNKNHTTHGLPYIFIYQGNEVIKIFLGPALNIDWDWTENAELPIRLPGLMASLFTERTVKMPQGLQVYAADEQDQMLVTAQFNASLELVVPDNQERQYSFIEEVTGSVELLLLWQGKKIEAKGLIYAEYVI
ncbi:hypothetical protein PN462_11310 [Spirulina sp. CS-785/01]|uniref:hypothetical protein n=1 Tax=Spirulina sp. CS-785/01 TaxID=3021716 RepID=UPI00232ABF4A|nr:hypothetical protein [Spirulina sp. CS-785/01]MDB9313689.1 hypothetical protein [Spirulina sp. CS-785/01]